MTPKTIPELESDALHDERNAGARAAVRQVEAGYYFRDDELDEWFDRLESDEPASMPELQYRPQRRVWR
ncbi:hypothetical protein [Paraburkholderia humisilvae]|uniref:hypothetical protein n=1 Tax=Paraburkholderia humisilvae TaxID=627669 RepID=UPI0015819E2B|nr:hypothetical protein [Paraburkholderia humisilvae]